MTTRRKFLTGTAAALAASAWAPLGLAEATRSATPPIRLKIASEQRPATVPETFTGLSYESAQLGHPDFFNADNAGLIALFKRLGGEGVLRLGGNTSDYTTWSASNTDAARNHTPDPFGADEGTAAKTASFITPKAIQTLRGFLEVTGWRAIYGLNLRHGTMENAAAEAKYVAKTLGPKLLFFQLGNEPDIYRDDKTHLPWTFGRYWSRWLRFHEAVSRAAPGASFGAPDVAAHYGWVLETAEKKPPIEMLTGHHYAEGPPSNSRMTLEFLLRRGKDPAASGEIATVKKAVRVSGKPYRMTEGNTCYGAGLAGASDTLASALWCGDYMLQVAQAGYVGVNLHGGGDILYTPIAGSAARGFTARPIYYGMLFAGEFRGCTFVDVSLSTQTKAQNVTAFAAQGGGKWKLAAFNKASAAVDLAVEGLPPHIAGGDVYLLEAPSIASKSQVTFGGSRVSASGKFRPQSSHRIRIRGGKGMLRLSPYTAALVVL